MISEEMSRRLISTGKKHANKSGRKISGHVNHLGGEGRNGFDTFVNVIYHQNGWRAIMMWWFPRQKFCISRLKIRRKKTQKERESSKECSVSFLWTNESFSLSKCLSRNSTLFSTRRIEALSLNFSRLLRVVNTPSVTFESTVR